MPDLIGVYAGPRPLVHSAERCIGQSCCIHNPSDHHMREWDLFWRPDLGVMERMCPHDTGHPDPDDLAHRRRIFGSDYDGSLHGCDGCCTPDGYIGATMTIVEGKPPRDPRHDKALRLAAAALMATLAGDITKGVRLVDIINTECGGDGLSLALMAWADAYVHHATDDRDRRPRRITTINGETGQMQPIEDSPPHVKWAARFIHARAAMDVDAVNGLIREMPDDPLSRGLCVITVLRLTADTINGLPRGFADMGRDGDVEP